MIESIDSLIKSGQIPPIVLIFGEEEYLIEEATNKLIKYLCPTEQSFYDFDSLDGDDTNENIIVQKALAYPMINDKRVLLVKRFDKLFSGRSKKPEKNSSFAKYLEKPASSTVLVLVSDIDSFSGISAGLRGKNVEKSKKQIENAKFPYNALLSKYEWVEFPKIYESNFPAWINSRFKSKGKSIAQDALELLLAQTQPSLRDISNEIDKICLFVGDRSQINTLDITEVTGSNRANNVFELQNAIGARNKQHSLKILYNMLADERQEMLIITMLTRYFTAVWKLQEASAKGLPDQQIAPKIGVSPYFLKDYKSAAQKYKTAEINNAIINLCQADLLLKSSGGDNLLIMQNLITKIIEGGK